MIEKPGERIQRELEIRGWQQADLAYVLGSSAADVSRLVRGRRAVSAYMSKMLGAAFQLPQATFLDLQMRVSLAKAIARRCDDGSIARRADLFIFPVKQMIDRRWIRDGSIDELERQMLKFFDVGSLSELAALTHSGNSTSEPRP